MGTKMNWDGIGIAASLACAIHCAVLPLMLTSLPLFGINIIHNMVFEWSMIAIAFFVGAYALSHGYTRHHRSVVPMFLFIMGFGFLCTKQFFHDLEIYFLVPAVLLISGAHYINYRMCHRLKCNSAHHKH